jgi:hypothetical protein
MIEMALQRATREAAYGNVSISHQLRSSLLLGRLVAALALVLLPGCAGLRSLPLQTITASSFTGEASEIELAALRMALDHHFRSLSSPFTIAIVTTAGRPAETRIKSSDLSPYLSLEAVESIHKIRSGDFRSGDKTFQSFFSVGAIIMESPARANVYIHNDEDFAWVPARKEGSSWIVRVRGTGASLGDAAAQRNSTGET